MARIPPDYRRILADAQALLIAALLVSSGYWAEPLFRESLRIADGLAFEFLRHLSEEEKRRLLEAVPYLSVLLVAVPYFIVTAISDQTSFRAWVSRHSAFNEWLLKEGHAASDVRKMGYSELRGKYGEYLVFRKRIEEARAARESELFSGVTIPRFLKLTWRETAFRITLAGFVLFPFVAGFAMPMIGISDNYEQVSIISMGMFGFAPLLVLTGIQSGDRTREIKRFCHLSRYPGFVEWCKKRGYSIEAGTDMETFSRWVEEFDVQENE